MNPTLQQRIIDRRIKLRDLCRRYRDERDTVRFIRARTLIIKLTALLEDE